MSGLKPGPISEARAKATVSEARAKATVSEVRAKATARGQGKVFVSAFSGRQ
jgi:hypothetical protein